MGAKGWVSSLEAQIMGAEAVQMYDVVKSGDVAAARTSQLRCLALDAVGGAVPVLAGTGGIATSEVIALSLAARSAGVQGIMVLPPYYCLPKRREILAHYRQVSDAVKLPIIIYNIPARSVIDMTTATMAELAKLPRIVGVKDATGDVGRVSDQRAACGADFIQLSGEDASALGFNAHGGVGCISVVANIAPRLCSEFQEAMLAGDWTRAIEYQDRLLPLHRAAFAEPSPAPTKYALSVLGKCTEELRSPILPVEEPTRERMRDAMRHAGLVN
jgi:4-hydroxy-tetrahydrodipicolinate synthase